MTVKRRGGVLWTFFVMAATVICAEASEFTAAIISDETGLQDSTNEISVRLYYNADLGVGKKITISGFVGSNTEAASLSLVVENNTVQTTAGWQKTPGALTVTLARDVPRSQSIKLRFTLVNPEAENDASTVTVSCTDCAADGSALGSLTKATASVLEVSYHRATCQDKSKYGDGNCDLLCQGVVKGSLCFCKPGQFGTGCSQTGTVVEEASTVVDSSSAATWILLSGGQGLRVPAGAVAGSSRVEVALKLYSLVPQPGAGEEFYGAGRAMAVGHRGLVFAKEATLFLDFDAALLYSGFSAAAVRRSEEAGRWERVGGSALTPATTQTGAADSKLAQVSISAGTEIGGTVAAMGEEDTPAVLPAFTEVLLGAETHLQGSHNEISARIFCSWPLRAGAHVTLSGLAGSQTPSSPRLAVVVDGAMAPGIPPTLSEVAQWSQGEGALVVTLAREVQPSEGLALRFSLLNPIRNWTVTQNANLNGAAGPAASGSSESEAALARVTASCERCVAAPAVSFLRMAPLSLLSDVLRVSDLPPPLCAAAGRYAEACARTCSGVVRGRECTCKPGQFGADCELTGTLLARATAIYDPALRAPLQMSIPDGGPALLLPPQALVSGIDRPLPVPGRVEVTLKLYSVPPGARAHWSQPGLVPSGRAVVLGPAGPALHNLKEASLTLELNPPADGLPLTTAAFHRGADGVWEELPGGRVVRGGWGPGLLVPIRALGTHAVFRFERLAEPGPRVTGAFVRGGSSVQGQPSLVSARLRFSATLAPAARLSLSGLAGSLSPSNPALPLVFPPPPPPPAGVNASELSAPPPAQLAATAEWDQGRGRLVVTLAQALPPSADLRFSFLLSNPLQTALGSTVLVACPACNAYTHPPQALAPLAVPTSVLAVEYAPSACEAPGMFGFDCRRACAGVVAGRVCLCAPGRFGEDCSQAGRVLEERAVLADNVQDAAITLTDGQGVRVPAGALAAGTQSEVLMTLYDVFPAAPAEQGLVATGRLAVLAPHGLQFVAPASLRLDHDPARLPPGYAASVHWLNPGTSRWEDVGGRILPQAGNLDIFAADVLHFSSFAVMAAPQPAPPPPATPDPLLSIFPLLGSRPDADAAVGAGWIYAGIFGGTAAALALCVCAVRQRRRGGEAQAGEEEAGSRQAASSALARARELAPPNLNMAAMLPVSTGTEKPRAGPPGHAAQAPALVQLAYAYRDTASGSAAQRSADHRHVHDLNHKQAQYQQAQLENLQAQPAHSRVPGLSAPPSSGCLPAGNPPSQAGVQVQVTRASALAGPDRVFSDTDLDGNWLQHSQAEFAPSHQAPPVAHRKESGRGRYDSEESLFARHSRLPIPPAMPAHTLLRAPFAADPLLLGGQREAEVWEV